MKLNQEQTTALWWMMDMLLNGYHISLDKTDIETATMVRKFLETQNFVEIIEDNPF